MRDENEMHVLFAVLHILLAWVVRWKANVTKLTSVHVRKTFSKVPYVKKRSLNDKFLRKMQLIYFTAVTLSFHTILEDTYLFTPPWLALKNSVTVEIGILQSQPFTNSNLHCLITMESATY